MASSISFFDAIVKVVGFSKKSHGVVTVRDILNYCEYCGIDVKDSLVDMGLRVLIDGKHQKDVSAFNVIKGSSIEFKKDDDGEYVLLKSHIDAIADTVETVGHLQVYVGDDLVVEVKG